MSNGAIFYLNPALGPQTKETVSAFNNQVECSRFRMTLCTQQWHSDAFQALSMVTTDTGFVLHKDSWSDGSGMRAQVIAQLTVKTGSAFKASALFSGHM